MSDPDLARLQNDLTTIRAAAGLDLPYQPAHVRISLVYAASAFACMIWAWLARDVALPYRLGVFILLFTAPPIAYAKLRHVPMPANTRFARESCGISLPFALVCLLGIALQISLTVQYHVPQAMGLLVLCSVQAVFWMTWAWRDPRMRGQLPAAAGLILLPLTWMWTALPLDVVLGFWMAVGFLAQAAAWHRQIARMN